MSTEVPIEEVIDSQISIADSFPTRAGFGVPLVACFHDRGIARIRDFTSADDVAAAFGELHPATHAARGYFAARLGRLLRVGRREGAPAQAIRITPVRTTVGFVHSVKIGTHDLEYTVVTADTVATICDGLVAAINAALGADIDGVLTALATAASIQTITRSAVNGAVGRDFATPRPLTVTRSAHADQDAVTALLTYLDEAGESVTDSLAFTNGGGDSFASSRRATRFVSLVIPAQAGVGGTTQIGVGAIAAATDGTTHVDLATSGAGVWLPYAFGGLATEMLVEDRTPEPGVTLATDLAAIAAESSDWYALVDGDIQSSAQIQAATAWALTAGKLPLFHSFDSAVTVAATVDDVASELSDAGVPCGLIYHRSGSHYSPGARWAGRHLPLVPGTETWALHKLDGLPVDVLETEERNAIAAKRANYYASLAGNGAVLGFKGGGFLTSGRAIDLHRFADFLDARIQESALVPFINEDKVPLDDDGIALVGSRVKGVLKAAADRGSLRNLVVDLPRFEDIPTADVEDRIISGIEWSALYVQPAHAVRPIRGRLALTLPAT